MKKILALALALMMVLSLAACGGDKEPAPSGSNGTSDPGTSQQTPSDDTDNPGASQETPSDDTNIPDPGNTSGEIVESGEAGAAAPSTVALPANVRMEISLDGNVDQSTVKIGNNYYTEDRYGEKVFFKYSAENEWVSYTLSDKGEWEENGYSTYDEVIDNCFITINRYTSLDVELVSTGHSQVIAGVKAKEYKYVLNGVDLFCWLSDDGISFNHNDLSVITVWDTAVTSFWVDTP